MPPLASGDSSAAVQAPPAPIADHPVANVRPQAGAAAHTAAANAAAAAPRSLEVHYELDAVTRKWVANVLDSGTGEVVRQVPAQHVHHQLHLLGKAPRFDSRA